MIPPRITLWSPPCEIPIRLVVERLNEPHLKKQALALQSSASSRTLTITPGAVYILSGVIGRRVAEPMRWVLLDSLRSVLQGELRNTHPERQDLLAPTLGEILGATLLALEFGGNVEIIRLLDSHRGTSPDFILLQNVAGAAPPVGHLLECKGVVEDVHNINARMTLDVCQHIRSLRNEGAEQLDLVNLDEVPFGAHVRVRPAALPFSLTEAVASKNLSVVCIPDGRIPRQVTRHGLVLPTRGVCTAPGIDCIQCMTSPSPPPVTNLICVLHTEKVKEGEMLGTGLQDFIIRYRKAQQAVWVGSESLFTASFNALRRALVQGDWGAEMRQTLAYMALTLLEAAAERQIRTAGVGARLFEQLADGLVKQALGEIVMTAESLEGQAAETITASPEGFIERARSGESEVGVRYLLRDSQLDVASETAPAIGIHGVLESEGALSVIRLTTDSVAADAYEVIKDYARELIEELRTRRNPTVKWRREYARLDQNEVEFGVSWDQFPYPHPDGKRLGITAWVSAEGRAEIIVRRLTGTEA